MLGQEESSQRLLSSAISPTCLVTLTPKAVITHIHAFIQPTLIESLLCTRHCANTEHVKAQKIPTIPRRTHFTRGTATEEGSAGSKRSNMRGGVLLLFFSNTESKSRDLVYPGGQGSLPSHIRGLSWLAWVSLGGKIEIYLFKHILPVGGLGDKGKKEKGERRQKAGMGPLFYHHSFITKSI